MSGSAQRVVMSLCVVGASFCHSFSSNASAIPGMHSLRGVLTAVQRQHATRDGELRQTGSKCHGGLSGVLFWLMIGSLSRRVLAGLGSPVRSRKEKTQLLLCAHKTRADTQKACRFRPMLSRRSFAVLAWMCICN